MSTYSQMHVQIVFAVKHRQSLIETSWEERLYQYITGTVQRMDQKLLAINGVKDHIHLLIGIRPNCRVSDLVREVKKASTELINEKKLSRHHFQWQEGYGVFTYSKSDLNNVINYIMNQKQHHRIKSFKEEYVELLQEFEVEYNEEYLFDWL
jgi:putative transposase